MRFCSNKETCKKKLRVSSTWNYSVNICLFFEDKNAVRGILSSSLPVFFSFGDVPFCCHGTNTSAPGFRKSGGDVQRTSQPSCTRCTGKSIEDGEGKGVMEGLGWRAQGWKPGKGAGIRVPNRALKSLPSSVYHAHIYELTHRREPWRHFHVLPLVHAISFYVFSPWVGPPWTSVCHECWSCLSHVWRVWHFSLKLHQCNFLFSSIGNFEKNLFYFIFF